MFYCSPEHQKEHYPSHKDACRAIANAESSADAEEQKLRSSPENPFETIVGRFHFHQTGDYMRAKYGVFQALEDIKTRDWRKTRDSTQMQLDHLTDLLRLCRGDGLRARDLAPALMLELGHDQDCYDFIKWYGMTGQIADYDWEDMSLGFLDVKNADPFEPVDLICGGLQDLSHILQLTLLKIKLLIDLKGLQNSIRALGKKVPAEILNIIQTNIPLTSIIAGNREILCRSDHTETIEKLTAQVEALYNAATIANKHLWPGILNPRMYLANRVPQGVSPGNVEEMRLIVSYNYELWFKTPGAIGVIKELSAKKGTASR